MKIIPIFDTSKIFEPSVDVSQLKGNIDCSIGEHRLIYLKLIKQTTPCVFLAGISIYDKLNNHPSLLSGEMKDNQITS